MVDAPPCVRATFASKQTIRDTRSHIRVLRLLEKFSLTQLADAVECALDIDMIDADSLRGIGQSPQLERWKCSTSRPP